MVTKGAAAQCARRLCRRRKLARVAVVDIAAVRGCESRSISRSSAARVFARWACIQGYGDRVADDKDDEAGMTFLGFLVFAIRPRPDIAGHHRAACKNLGVSLKIITGDNHLVAANVSQQMGLSKPNILDRSGSPPVERRGAAANA